MKVKVKRPDKHCLFCNRVISPGRNGTRKFCCNAHRVAYHRQLKREAVKV
jgi:predicted nucleic acid-binding Zn ribbon protein